MYQFPEYLLDIEQLNQAISALEGHRDAISAHEDFMLPHSTASTSTAATSTSQELIPVATKGDNQMVGDLAFVMFQQMKTLHFTSTRKQLRPQDDTLSQRSLTTEIQKNCIPKLNQAMDVTADQVIQALTLSLKMNALLLIAKFLRAKTSTVEGLDNIKKMVHDIIKPEEIEEFIPIKNHPKFSTLLIEAFVPHYRRGYVDRSGLLHSTTGIVPSGELTLLILSVLSPNDRVHAFYSVPNFLTTTIEKGRVEYVETLLENLTPTQQSAFLFHNDALQKAINTPNNVAMIHTLLSGLEGHIKLRVLAGDSHRGIAPVYLAFKKRDASAATELLTGLTPEQLGSILKSYAGAKIPKELDEALRQPRPITHEEYQVVYTLMLVREHAENNLQHLPVELIFCIFQAFFGLRGCELKLVDNTPISKRIVIFAAFFAPRPEPVSSTCVLAEDSMAASTDDTSILDEPSYDEPPRPRLKARMQSH